MNEQKSKSLWERVKHYSEPSLTLLNGVIGPVAFMAYRASIASSYMIEHKLNGTYVQLYSGFTTIGAYLVLICLILFVFTCVTRIKHLDTSHIDNISKGQLLTIKFQECLLSVGYAMAGLLLMILIASAIG